MTRHTWNYLRVRGEYPEFRRWEDAQWELPPRARRILWGYRGGVYVIGTTSACAENTANTFTMWWFNGNYLRVRGEYLGRDCEVLVIKELPPRARRIP